MALLFLLLSLVLFIHLFSPSSPLKISFFSFPSFLKLTGQVGSLFFLGLSLYYPSLAFQATPFENRFPPDLSLLVAPKSSWEKVGKGES